MDQAVIAIENARLFRSCNSAIELTEALEQQTATAESCASSRSSPTDPQPVLDAIVRARLPPERTPKPGVISAAPTATVPLCDLRSQLVAKTA